MYAVFIFIAISSRSRSSWSFCLLKKHLAIEERATGCCLTHRAVTVLKWLFAWTMKLNGFLFKAIWARTKLWFPCNPRYLKANTAGHAVVFFHKHQPREFVFSLGMEFSFLGHIWCWCFRFSWALLQSSSAAISTVPFLNWFTGWCLMSGGRKEGTLWIRALSFRFFDVLSCFSVPLSFAFHSLMMGTKWLGPNQVPGRLSKAPALNPRMLTLSAGISDSVDSLMEINVEVNRKVAFILQKLLLRYQERWPFPNNRCRQRLNLHCLALVLSMQPSFLLDF